MKTAQKSSSRVFGPATVQPQFDASSPSTRSPPCLISFSLVLGSGLPKSLCVAASHHCCSASDELSSHHPPTNQYHQHTFFSPLFLLLSLVFTRNDSSTLDQDRTHVT
ncbi:hypothetical protein V6N13_085125 [Hibiscus sabdariffa]|uniref:Uncharacterized protein n=1 Tax=Hibiscus sabdariffa TaxID=183260 RepID=A0ABR2D0N1_9ROSI